MKIYKYELKQAVGSTTVQFKGKTYWATVDYPRLMYQQWKEYGGTRWRHCATLRLNGGTAASVIRGIGRRGR